jgi:hypothetical protein
MGYEEEAEIINAHMTYSPFSDIDKATEVDLVCLGDRTVIEDRFVGVEDRINYIVDKATRHGHPEAKTEIVKYKLDTERFVAQIEERIGVTLQELMKGVTIEDI